MVLYPALIILRQAIDAAWEWREREDAIFEAADKQAKEHGLTYEERGQLMHQLRAKAAQQRAAENQKEMEDVQKYNPGVGWGFVILLGIVIGFSLLWDACTAWLTGMEGNTQ